LALLFDANLRRSENVTGGMKRHVDTVYLNSLAVIERFNSRVRAEACTQKCFAGTRAQISLGTGTQVIRMGVRDDGAVYGIPRVDVKIAGWAVEAVNIGFEKIAHRCLKLV
jgi:hypothetical protein